MPAVIPLPVGSSSGYSGQFWSQTDGSIGNQPVQEDHSLMFDSGLSGAVDTTVPIGGSGNTNIYVGVLVLIALTGVIGMHLGGFRFAGDVSAGR